MNRVNVEEIMPALWAPGAVVACRLLPLARLLDRDKGLQPVDAWLHFPVLDFKGVGRDPEEPNAFGMRRTAVPFGVSGRVIAVEVGEVVGVGAFAGNVGLAELTANSDTDVAQGRSGRRVEPRVRGTWVACV